MFMDRYVSYPRATQDRPKMIYEYYVTGSGVFPFDMLRYDSCWPCGPEDAAHMDYQRYEDSHRKIRSVKLRSWREPTIDRWSSFGWSVGRNKL